MTSEYFVRTNQFEGPLDLLLHLIRVHEIDMPNIRRGYPSISDCVRTPVVTSGTLLASFNTLYGSPCSVQAALHADVWTSLGVSDRDGDGVPNRLDRFPGNPRRE